MDRSLITAHGKFVAVVASVLQAAGVTTTDEFARLLQTFAQVVDEDDPQEAEILAQWADTIAAMLPPETRN